MVRLATCPANGETEVGINTWISVDLNAEVAAPLPEEALTMTCGDVSIPGSHTADGTHLAFIPEQSLPPEAECTVTLESSAAAAGEAAVEPGIWHFVSSDVEGTAWAFGTPQRLVFPPASGAVAQVVSDGDDVLVHWSEGTDVLVGYAPCGWLTARRLAGNLGRHQGLKPPYSPC